MLYANSLNQVGNQLLAGMSYIGDDMSQTNDYRMNTCSTCDGTCSGTCDDSCEGGCEGCGNNG